MYCQHMLGGLETLHFKRNKKIMKLFSMQRVTCNTSFGCHVGSENKYKKYLQ